MTRVWGSPRKDAWLQAQVLPSQSCLVNYDPCHLLVWVTLCPHAASGAQSRSFVNERRRYTTAWHSGFSPACWQNIRLYFKITGKCFLSWLLWDSWKRESGWVAGKITKTWSDCPWVAESISSLIAYDVQESKRLRAHKDSGGQGGGKKGHPSDYCDHTPHNASSAFYNLSSLFLFVPMSSKSPIILRERF